MSYPVPYTPELKALVALEALKGAMSVDQLASKYGIRPHLVVQWKRQASDGLVRLFEPEARPGAGVAACADSTLLSREERVFFNRQP